MTKSKTLIQIFPLITDIDLLERILIQLKQNSLLVDKDKFHIILDVTLPITDYLVNWEDSILKQDYFIDKFNSLKSYGNWADECYFNVSKDIKGCVDYCIDNVYKYKDVDNIIWLDPDVFFNQYTLSTFLEASLEIKKQHSKYIITPEYVKLWDATWDVMTNDTFISKPYTYTENHDPIIDSSQVYGDIILEPMSNIFKFGGGWFTMLSKELLDYFEFPRDVKGYSPIDTYVMHFSKLTPEAIQYKIKNLVVCQDKTYRDSAFYKKYVKTINRKHDDYNEIWSKLTASGNRVINKNKKI